MSSIVASTYEIIEEIGSGGGGVVYLANHLRLNKKVIIKADKRPVTSRIDSLRREVDTLKDLNHLRIPKVYDFFIENGTVYTAIDYVEGESFDKALKRGEKFSQAQVVKWAKQLCDALVYLHSPVHGDPPKGFLHSDIKPANLMLTPQDDICLIDFNIALALGEENVIGCSPGYASPEHYGLDYSFKNDEQKASDTGAAVLTGNMIEKTDETELLSDETVLQPVSDTVLIDQTVMSSESTISLSDDTVLLGADTVLLTDKNTFISDDTIDLADNTKHITNVTESLKYRVDRVSVLDEINSNSGSKTRIVVPDVRSDVYSVGATLYHLLSGIRPAKDALEVVPLSETEFSPPLVRIISKAMMPNPDLRYQSMEEMLKDLRNLKKNDPRVINIRRQNIITGIVCCTLLTVGLFLSFIGLKRMQVVESWLKLAEYSQTAMSKGDSVSALDYAMQALPERKCLFTPQMLSEAQKSLTDVLGVYDLSDGFKKYKVVELPSNPLYVTISPHGETAACVYAGHIAIFNTDTAEITGIMDADKSALSEVEYLNDDTIIFAGSDGINCYNIKTKSTEWSGKPCTAISVSQDKSTVAAVYKDASKAIIYDAVTGAVKNEIDFGNKSQRVTVNDTFANPKDNLFEINPDGTLLAVSFADGSLDIFDLSFSGNDIELFDSNSGYTHFEGGFYKQYLAFSATNSKGSVFAVIDTVEKVQTGGFNSDGYFGVKTDSKGVYVQRDNLLVSIHPLTGEQTPLVTTPQTLYRFSTDGNHTVVTSKDQIMFFNSNSDLISSFKENETGDFVELSDGIALIGSIDTPVIRIMRYENHSKTDVFKYDTDYQHDELRVSADMRTVILFSYKQFRVYGINGNLIKEVDIPDADQVYDQQFIRENGKSFLAVTYNDGKVLTYDAKDGNLISKRMIDTPDLSLYEEFYTDKFRIESPLHGAPSVYDKKSDKLVCNLEEEGYLTYITQSGDYIIAQYITEDNYYYGVLMNNKCESLAVLPYLTDVYNDELYFDYSSGNVRKTGIYSIEELKNLAREELRGGK